MTKVVISNNTMMGVYSRIYIYIYSVYYRALCKSYIRYIYNIHLVDGWNHHPEYPWRKLFKQKSDVTRCIISQVRTARTTDWSESLNMSELFRGIITGGKSPLGNNHRIRWDQRSSKFTIFNLARLVVLSVS